MWAVCALSHGLLCHRDLEHVRILRERVLSDIEQYESDTTTAKIEMGGPGWWHNWQGGRPPPTKEFLFDDFCYNEFVIAAVTGTIRANGSMPPTWDGSLSGGYSLINMSFRGDMVQELHTDAGSAPIDPAATPADLLGAPHRINHWSVNFPLVEQNIETGATEYWAGSHLDPGLKRGRADPAGRFATVGMCTEYEALHGPPRRTFVDCGDAIIRNGLVWHRGVGNHSNTHRPMISIGYGADTDSSDRHGFGGDGTRIGSGFSAPKDTAEFWSKHPKMSYTPALVDTVDYQLEQRYHGPTWVPELGRWLPGHLSRGRGPFGTMLDPVITLAGCTYEREEIEATLAGNGGIDPTCNIRVMPKLIRNEEVARQIKAWLQDGTIARM